jgi:hypothetical protein
MLRIIIFSIVLMALSSCVPSDVQDYFPKVTTVTAKVLADGRVVIEGKLDATGTAPIQFLGGCYSTKPQFGLLENQRTTDTLYPDNSFKITYDDDFKYDSTYYFRVWALNEHGYVYGSVVSLSKISALPVVPPCTLTMHRYSILNNTYYPITAVTKSLGWKTTIFTLSSSTGLGMTVELAGTLKTGIYNAGNSLAFAGNASVSFYQSGGMQSVKAGNKVYVNQISSGVYEITVCNATWNLNGGATTQYANAKFKYPY